MSHDYPLKALHHNRGECNGTTVVKAAPWGFLREKHYGASLEAGGHINLRQGQVEYICEDLGQLR